MYELSRMGVEWGGVGQGQGRAIQARLVQAGAMCSDCCLLFLTKA